MGGGGQQGGKMFSLSFLNDVSDTDSPPSGRWIILSGDWLESGQKKIVNIIQQLSPHTLAVRYKENQIRPKIITVRRDVISWTELKTRNRVQNLDLIETWRHPKSSTLVQDDLEVLKINLGVPSRFFKFIEEENVF